MATTIGQVVSDDDLIWIRKLRQLSTKLLEKFPQYNTDFALLRYLRANNYNLEIAAQKLKWSMNCLNAIGVFDKDMSTVESIHQCVRAVTPAAEYFPGGNLGYDQNGYVVTMLNIGSADPKSLVDSGRVSELYIASLYDCEGTQSLIRAEEAVRGYKLGAIMIIDLSGFSFDVIFHVPATKIYMNVLIMIQQLFPDTSVKLYVVNASMAVNALLRMVQMILAKMKTHGVIEILGSDWQQVLVKRHGSENLPKSCGGTKSDDLLRKGGVVPRAVRESVRKLEYPNELLTEVTVSAQDVVQIPVEVRKQGVQLSWYFTCSYGDIDFSIKFGDDEVWPCFRISTQFWPEFGEITCQECGIYQITFSNKHGRLWKKHIFYKIDVS